MNNSVIDEKISFSHSLPALPAIKKRPRRNRKNPAIRSLIQETHLLPSSLIAPLFVVEGKNQKQVIPSLPEIFRFSVDVLKKEVEELYDLGIRAINLFPMIENHKKDPLGSEALRSNSLIYHAIKEVKKAIPEMYIMADIALDPYTSHGHDGITDDDGKILNDETLLYLAQMSLLAAESGVDMVAPSDMMDGRIQYIRETLDAAGFTEVGILAYAAKYASAFYGPFREALNSNLKFGDKKSYQLNPANSREAMLELQLDELEGADMLLIKPALAYLDIIAKARSITHLPIGGYHVSGEYAMVMAAAKNGWVHGDKVMNECLISIKRAGADFIFTYAAKRTAFLIKTNEFYT